MSRHRNIRNYAYEDDMFEDVYGHSVEEHDLCVSPTTAQQFMFHRGESRHPNLSSFMEESLGYDEEDAGEFEEDAEHRGISQDYKTPKLDKESEAKLRSCMDEFRSILGDHCDEQQATAAILKHNFDLERALDDVLSKGGTQDLKSRERSRKEKDSLKIESQSKQHDLARKTPSPRKVMSADIVQSKFEGPSLEGKSTSGGEHLRGQEGSGDSTDEKQISLLGKLLSQSNERSGSSLLSQFSTKGHLGSPGNQTSLSSTDGPPVVSKLGSLNTPQINQDGSTHSSLLSQISYKGHPGSPGGLRELSQSDNQSGTSLLSQLSTKGHLGSTKDKGCPPGASKVVSLRELGQSNERSGTSMLNQLLTKKQLGSRSGLQGMMSFDSGHKVKSSSCSSLKTNEVHRMPLSSSASVQQNKVIPLGGVTLASLSSQFSKTNTLELAGESGKGYTKSKENSLTSLMSVPPGTPTSWNTSESSNLQESGGRTVLGGLSRHGLGEPLSVISKKECTKFVEQTGTPHVPLTSTSLAHMNTDLKNTLPSNAFPMGLSSQQSNSDIPQWAKDVDLSVSLKRNQPKQKLHSTVQSSDPRNLTEKLEKSVQKSQLCDAESASPKVVVNLKTTPVDVEDGPPTDLVGHNEYSISSNVKELIGTPTMFACTLLVKYKKPADIRMPVVEGGFFEDIQELSDIVPFNFNTPSPDDIVKSKQKEAFRKK